MSTYITTPNVEDLFETLKNWEKQGVTNFYIYKRSKIGDWELKINKGQSYKLKK